jgi:monoamine oxidase
LLHDGLTPRPPSNPLNPTNSQRHEIVRNAFIKAGRPEDFENVIRLLSPPPDITNYGKPGEFRNVKIGIIGGGVAGLSAAFELRKLGFDITLFEAHEKRLGGRIYTHYFDKEKKLYGEFGATRIPVVHETSWHYINLFKLNTTPFIQSNPNSFIYVRGTRVRNDVRGKNVVDKVYPLFRLTEKEKNTPWPELHYQVIRKILARIPVENRREILQVLPKYTPPYSNYTRINARQAMRQFGLSDEAINLITSTTPLASGLLYTGYDEPLGVEYPLSFMNLYKINGGAVNLPISFYNSLTSKYPKEYKNIPYNLLGGFLWKPGTVVNGIFKSGKDGKTVLRYFNKLSPEYTYEAFDYILCTVPLSELRKIEIKPMFSNRKMQAIKEVNYMNAQKTAFLCKERFWERGNESERIIGGASYTDLLIQSILYPTRDMYKEGNTEIKPVYNPNETGVFTASYNLDLDAVRLGPMPENERLNLIKAQVAEVHGLPKGYLDSIVLDYKTVDWNKETRFSGGFTMLLPEQRSTFLYELSRPEYDNRVFFAGEHTSTKHGWVQGSLQSAMLAANRLVYYAKTSNY